MTTPEDTELPEQITKYVRIAMTYARKNPYSHAGPMEKDVTNILMNLITLHTKDVERNARLNELTHRANEAIERMYRLDREYAGNYIQSMREFYPINPTEAGEL